MTNAFTPELYEKNVLLFRQQTKAYLDTLSGLITGQPRSLFYTQAGQIYPKDYSVNPMIKNGFSSNTRTPIKSIKDYILGDEHQKIEQHKILPRLKIQVPPENLGPLQKMIQDTQDSLDVAPMSTTLSTLQTIHEQVLQAIANPDLNNPFSSTHYLGLLNSDVLSIANVSQIPPAGGHSQWDAWQRERFAHTIRPAVETVNFLLQSKPFLFSLYRQCFEAWTQVFNMDMMAGLLNETERLDNARLKIKGDQQKTLQEKHHQTLEELAWHIESVIKEGPTFRAFKDAEKEAYHYYQESYKGAPTHEDSIRYRTLRTLETLNSKNYSVGLAFLDDAFLQTASAVQKAHQTSSLEPDLMTQLCQKLSQPALFLKEVSPVIDLLQQQMLISEHEQLIRQQEHLIRHVKYTEARVLFIHRFQGLVYQHVKNPPISEMPPLQKISAYGVKALQALRVNVTTPAFMIDLTQKTPYHDILHRYFSKDPEAFHLEHEGETSYDRPQAIALQQALHKLSDDQQKDLKKELEAQVIPQIIQAVLTSTKDTSKNGAMSFSDLISYEKQHAQVHNLLRQHDHALSRFDESPYYRFLREHHHHQKALQQLRDAGFFEGTSPSEESKTMSISTPPNLAHATSKASFEDQKVENITTYPHAIHLITDYLDPTKVVNALETSHLPNALIQLHSPYRNAYDAKAFLANGLSTLEKHAKAHITEQQRLIQLTAQKLGGAQTQTRTEPIIEAQEERTIEVEVPILPKSLKQIKGIEKQDNMGALKQENPLPLLKR